MRLAPRIARWAEFHPIAVRVIVAIGLLMWWIVPAALSSYVDLFIQNHGNQNQDIEQIQDNRSAPGQEHRLHH
ncbi:hypothetical protein IQ235_00925 [Oscillatoriales cyanobacterium LEGE 11467]|uniref:Uncharacterized protein n=1 Tax=Zarconia navalis LEGE 11467 TaxID=1828826 RepID=A0A928VWC7_9CYAN|nr:hypothetical protein [Zarconia navalis]MBE9039358.1 hypothetical protein [Zarconia navalis LEGE 11467]